MTQKERLAKVIQRQYGYDVIISTAKCGAYGAYYERVDAETLSDYLLANGVIVPIFQIGEKIFVIDTDDEIRERTVSALFFRKKVCVVYTCGSGILETVYEQSHQNGAGLYRTREEAEEALNGRVNNDAERTIG